MTNPKLALIPSGYKGGTNPTVYSILPNDGSGDFDYERNGNATRVRKDGLIEELTVDDTPRLDWLNSDCPSLLLEPQRVNRQFYSEQINNAVWTKVSTTVTADQTIAPSGEYTADKVQRTSTVANYVIDSASKSASAELDITTSMFVKKGEGDFFAIRQQGSYPNRGEVKYQFSTNTITTSVAGSDFTVVGSSVEDYGNGWVRISATFNTDASSTVSTLFIPRATDGTVDASDTSDSAYAYVWGVQVEEGYLTSYIKTEGSTVTRLFDDLESDTSYSTGNDVTWFLDFDTYTFENSFRAAMVVRNSGFTQSMDLISYNSGSDYYIRIRATNQSALQTIIAFGEDAIQMFRRNKVAVRLYGSNFEIYVNGTREYTGTSDDGDWTLLNNSAILNDFGTTSERPSTKLYDFRVYDQTMTQSELEELTTL